MSNHPNRSKGPKGPSANPDPAEIRAARGDMSQTEAAALIYSTLRTWQDWEAGKARMHPGLWELFNIKRTSASKTP